MLQMPLFTAIRSFACGLLLLLFFLLNASCRPQPEASPEVIVLHTGRLRGNIYPLELQAIAPLQHYQYVAGYVAAVRREAERVGARVVLVDLGDSLGGSFASHVTHSMNVVEFFNRTGYDAIQLGNLDNQVSGETLAGLQGTILSPFAGPDGSPAMPGSGVAAEIAPALDGLPPVYLIANYYGDTDPAEYPDRFPNTFGPTQSGVEPVRDYAAVMEALGPLPEDALVLFGWAKFESPETPPEHFLAQLRELGIDAILAQRVYGSRQRDVWSENRFADWAPPVSQNILRNNGGFTVARMDLRREGNRWVVVRQELVPMTSNSAEADADIIAAEAEFALPILEADRAIAAIDQAFGEEQILEIFLHGLTTIGNPGAVAYSLQSIRSEWPAGTLRASTVFNSLPWTSPLVSMRVEAAELGSLRTANPGLTFWLRQDLPADGQEISLVTSSYFAKIFAFQLGQPLEAIQTLDYPAEFDFFLGFLENTPAAFDAGLPAGWLPPAAAPTP